MAVAEAPGVVQADLGDGQQVVEPAPPLPEHAQDQWIEAKCHGAELWASDADNLRSLYSGISWTRAINAAANTPKAMPE